MRVGDTGGDGWRQREAEKETDACAPNHVLVHVLASPQELQREVLNVSIAERLRRPDYAGQISFHQVKHQIERTERLLEARLDHLAEPHNIRVVGPRHQPNLLLDPLQLRRIFNLPLVVRFDRDFGIGQLVQYQAHHTKRPCAENFAEVVHV